MTASGDLRLSVFGREGLPAFADLLSRRMKEAEDAAALGKHRLCWQGAWLHIFLHVPQFVSEQGANGHSNVHG